MSEDDGGERGPTVTRAALEADLRALGVARGDALVVHSSLSSLGWVVGGADAVVDALCGAVGPDGTVVVPTFTFAAGDAFDPAAPSRTGAVTEALRTREGAARSDHPTHSVAALGADAAALVADHPPTATLDRDGPLHRCLRDGGRVLLLGVDDRRNSSLHVAEALAGVPYREGTRTVRTTVGAGEGTRTVEIGRVGCARGFERFGDAARVAGVGTRGRVADADARLYDGPAMLALARALLAADPGVLLCDDPDCWWCPDARTALSGHDPRY